MPWHAWHAHFDLPLLRLHTLRTFAVPDAPLECEAAPDIPKPPILTQPCRRTNDHTHEQDGFDLDLTYITPNLLAMGFPSSGVKGMYRNPANEVKKFLASKHGEHYWVTNLCSERSYPPTLFDDRVSVKKQ